MGKTVRLSDIAKKVGVSTVTVSKALSGQKGVSEQKRDEIRKLAADMGYQKTMVAAGQKKSYTIGVVVPENLFSGRQSYYWAYFQELSRKARDRGNLPVLEVVSEKEQDGSRVPGLIQGGQVRGIIFLGSFHEKYGKTMVDATKVPYLFLDAPGIGDGKDSIVTDNLRMAYQLTNYLFSMGHRRIGFIGTRTLTDAIDDRFLGYIKSLMAHGVQLNPAYVLDDRDPKTGDFNPARYFNIDRKDMPTAYLCSTDTSASCFAARLQQDGLTVPKDVSLAGFEDFLPDHLYGLQLTSCRVNLEEIAEKAVTTLVRKIEGTLYTPGTFEVSGTLSFGSSVKKIGKAVSFV